MRPDRTLQTLQLTQDAVGPVARGHPWVYRDGVRGRAPVGAVVALADPRGGAVGFGLFDEGDIAVRVLGREPQPVPAVVAERVQRADALRVRLLGADTDAYRVVNGAGDGLPGVVVDRYGALAVLRLYSAAWVPWMDALVDAISGLGWVETVFRRLGVARVDGQDGGVTLRGPEAPQVVVVQEHGLRFLARPWAGQKTGLFLDQREHRRRVGALAAGRRVLNLFAYNGGFSVYAAAGGAARVVSVDLAAPALEDAREAFRLNGLDPDRHGFEVADVFRWPAPGRFDLVVCDPPSLTHGKRSDGAARSAYRDLAGRVGPWVTVDGLLASASCTARLSMERWEEAVWTGLRRSGRWSLLERSEAPADHPVAIGHPEGRYLKFALLRRLSDERRR
ncbi:MAG: class I SAM-dependent rRNA methyltransferase [Alphaproteobacteria bacterium]|nr:class I SAM-dependent rRNA methyltransferase [Alphaproteobacteria bacterium]